MESVGAYEAKTYLPSLLERVARGETIVITKHGQPIARLVPFDAPSLRRSPADFAEAFRKIRERVKPGGPSVLDMIRAGRRR